MQLKNILTTLYEEAYNEQERFFNFFSSNYVVSSRYLAVTRNTFSKMIETT